tara:strand:- start:13108 stop:13479 length:372 start_codon:yes stop_codon:yes gene_type:complete
MMDGELGIHLPGDNPDYELYSHRCYGAYYAVMVEFDPIQHRHILTWMDWDHKEQLIIDDDYIHMKPSSWVTAMDLIRCLPFFVALESPHHHSLWTGVVDDIRSFLKSNQNHILDEAHIPHEEA